MTDETKAPEGATAAMSAGKEEMCMCGHIGNVPVGYFAGHYSFVLAPPERVPRTALVGIEHDDGNLEVYVGEGHGRCSVDGCGCVQFTWQPPTKQ